MWQRTEFQWRCDNVDSNRTNQFTLGECSKVVFRLQRSINACVARIYPNVKLVCINVVDDNDCDGDYDNYSNKNNNDKLLDDVVSLDSGLGGART